MSEKPISIGDNSLGNLFKKVPQSPTPSTTQNPEALALEAKKAAEANRNRVAKVIKQWLALKQFDQASVYDGKILVGKMASMLSRLLDAKEIFFVVSKQPAGAPKLTESSLMTRVIFPNQETYDQFVGVSSQTGKPGNPNAPLEKFYSISTLIADPELTMGDLNGSQFNDLIVNTVMHRQIAMDEHVLINPKIYGLFKNNGINIALTYTDMTTFPTV